MDFISAILLGLIQGITEWLPVSSTGHLVLAQKVMNISTTQTVMFDLILHIATLCSVLIFLRKELKNIARAMFTEKNKLNESGIRSRRLGSFTILATIPIILVGLIAANHLNDIFTPEATAVALLITGVILWLAEIPRLRKDRKELNLKDAIIIGCLQAISIAPGISRSGTTISGGCYRGLNRELVAVFSFLLSILAIAAAAVYGLAFADDFQIDWLPTLAAAIVAFIAGLIVLRWLFEMIKKFKLRMFSVYCWAIGAISLILLTIY